MSLKEEQKEKVRTNKHTTSKKKSKQKTTPKRKLSPTVKPQGMTLSDWQVALRRMAAKDEQMTVRCVDDRNLTGEYIVRSGKSQQQYKVYTAVRKALQSAEKTEQLVNTLVHTDEQTGETTLRIPVADKQTVRNILGMIGKLFGQ